MKVGTKVVMIDCQEANEHKDKVWKTRSEPWLLGHGEEVVLLEGKAGGFAVQCLRPVEESL